MPNRRHWNVLWLAEMFFIRLLQGYLVFCISNLHFIAWPLMNVAFWVDELDSDLRGNKVGDVSPQERGAL